MDAILTAKTEFWVSFGMGMLLLLPIALEFAKRNLPIVFGVIIFLIVVESLSTQSPEMHLLWMQLSQIPQFIQLLLYQLVNVMF